MQGPLANYRIVDLTMYLAGPLASMYLGDLGADVIKVEPIAGDPLRGSGPPFCEGGDSAYYMMGNRNKRSMCLDLKSSEGKAVLLRLVKDADVVLENFRPGVMARLGLGYEELVKVNPKLIYVGLSGFGETGPYRDLPAFDHVIQAYSGWMSITGTEETGPLRPGPSVADLLGGIHTAFATALALLHRERTGKGQKVGVSLLDGLVSTLFPQVLSFLYEGIVPKRTGNMHPIIVPFGTFAAKDGLINVAVGTVPQWQGLCAQLGMEDLADNPEYHANAGRWHHRDEVHSRMAAGLAHKTRREWVEIFGKMGIPCAPVNDLRDVYEDPQVRHNHMFIDLPHPKAGSLKVINNPFRLEQMDPSKWRAPPALGADTDAILGGIGMSADEVSRLKQRHVVA
jgi:crotonobetainyl-CoA:carnitine CoA-transferase CaiB-like acyl-CoA transferase